MGIARGTGLAVVLGMGLSLGAGAGSATPAVHCGSVLTTSTTLTADLLDCPGTGLVVGADGITVDLDGHAVSGTNAAGGEGIAVDGHSGVRIVDGRIGGFRVNGVGIRGGHGNVVSGLRIRRIGDGGVEGEPVSAGVAVNASPGVRVTGNDIANTVDAWQSDGVDVVDSPGSVVTGNRLRGNAWNGLVLVGSAGSRVVGNRLDANLNNGMEVNGASDGVVVRENTADRNTQVGIVVGSAADARVTGNSASGNQTGLFFFDLHDSLIQANTARSNGDGLDLLGGQFGSDGNRVLGNVASGNRSTGIGIAFGADDNLVAGNTAEGNRGGIGEGGGMYVQESTGNRLLRNAANGNSDSGIVLVEGQPGDTAGNTLGGNTADRNANHGIDALPGTVDAGGNRASGNRVLPQCVNLVCTP